MRTPTSIPLVAILVVLLFLPSGAEATMWCNMDNAGGSNSKKVQQKSARAAAAFLQSASATFQMLAQLELHLSGDSNALASAAKLGAQGTSDLNRTLNELKELIGDSSSLKAINEGLRKGRDPSEAFRQALVNPASPSGTLVTAAGEKGAEALLLICSEAAERLRSPETPMGQIYLAVAEQKVPQPPVIWAGLAQWNEALVRGRLVAAMFGTLKQ